MRFLKSLVEKLSGKPVDWDDLEESLIRADLGVQMMQHLIKTLQSGGDTVSADDVMKVARTEIGKILPYDNPAMRPLPNKPKVIMLVGVNGTGKTTSTAKLAHLLRSRRYGVMLAAADTFRAAAIEQLGIWSERIGVEMIRGQYNADPAALCYDAYVATERKNLEFLLCDTAGRLHTKSNLMEELNKVKRTLAKHDPEAPHECLLVVDATTGTNALQQAKEFHKAVGLTGLIVTKLDGSGKGGVVVAIQKELGIPTRFVGTGEQLEDFATFDKDAFVEKMF